VSWTGRCLKERAGLRGVAGGGSRGGVGGERGGEGVLRGLCIDVQRERERERERDRHV
jgi:hypothetical protein